VARIALAWLFRRPVQLLAVLGVGVGLLALLVVLAVMNGLIEMNRSGVRSLAADLHLVPPPQEETLAWEPWRAALAGVAEVEATSPHLVAYALIGFPGLRADPTNPRNADSLQVQVVGLDPEAELAVTGFGGALREAAVAPVADPEHPFTIPGADADPFARPGVILSDTLAPVRDAASLRALRVELGALPWRLPPAGETVTPVNAQFSIAGTYEASDYRVSLDRVYARRDGPYGLRRNLLGTKAPEFSEVLIKLRAGADPERAKSAIRAALLAAGLPPPGPETGGELVTWEERNATFLSAIHNERRMITLVLFFIVIVAAFGLFAVLAALVREKVRELGVLSALGASPARRGALVFGVGAAAAAAGAGAGLGGAWLLVRHKDAVADFLRERLGIEIFPAQLYVVDGLPAQWDPAAAAWLTAGALGIGLLFALAPTMRAVLLDPVEALRYE
jgi:ABC-type lipoprotein release transport system permease subunit